MKAEQYIKLNCINGEGPVWDEQKQCLSFIDVFGNCIYTYEKSGLKKIDVGENIGCAVPCTDGNWVAGLLSGWYRVNAQTGAKNLLCNPEPNPNTRCNDGKADAFGNLWIGTMSRSLDSGAGEAQPEAGLYCMDTTGKLHTMLKGLYLGNGLCWTADSRTFYYIDTICHNVQAFDYSPETVSLSNRRVVFEISESLGLPDGMTIDADGNLWIALFGGFSVLKINPHTGKTLDKVELPCPNVTCACFGGANMDELFITTGAQGTDLTQYPEAGSIYRVKAGVRGAPSFICSV